MGSFTVVNKKSILVIFFANLYCVSSQELNPNKLCTDVQNRDACNNIERDGTYECAENIFSKIDCILNIDQGKPQFTIIKPESALLAASFIKDEVHVIGEVNTVKPPYQTVVIVRKNAYNNSFESLRKKRFCHPGFKHDELVTRYVLEEFDSTIVKLNYTLCDDNNNITLLEKRIQTLSNFFTSSCRPGQWTEDSELDENLKKKYPNLCDLCGSDKCNVNYQQPFKSALTCLTQSGGDVALTTLADAVEFFNQTDNLGSFSYLCRNGSINDPTNPCVWTKQLNRLIVTHRSIADNPKQYLEKNLQNHISSFSTQALGSKVPVTDALEKLLELNSDDQITFVDPIPLTKFVSEHRIIPTVENNTYCKEVVNWCTQTDLEQTKCLWLQQAALNYGLQPVVGCVKCEDNSTVSCLTDVQNGKCDITFADVTYGYIALKKGLTSVAYPETITKEIATIVIVVRNDTADIHSFQDLKGKSACVPQYGGREWLAFIDTLRTNNLMGKLCDYSSFFSAFVGDSCVPGAKDKDLNFDTGDEDKLCFKCVPTEITGTAAYCNADNMNKYYGTDGALRCLENKAGDYAVITIKDINEFQNKTQSFRILTKQNSLAQNVGINLDPEIALTSIISGELVIKNDSPKRENTIQLLRGIEIEFGQSLTKSFKVFEIFNGTKDLLFPDSTPGLTFDGTESVIYVDNFKVLLRNSDKCLTDPNGSHNLLPSAFLTMILMLIIRF